MGLVNGLADRVLDRFFASFINGTPDGVIDGPLMSLVNGLADRVVDCTSTCLVGWHHHRVVHVPSGCLGDHPTALHLLVFVINFVSLAIACFLDLVVHSFANCTHASISSACHRRRSHVIALSGSPASTTALIADGTAISGARGISTNHDRTDHNGGQDPQPIHLDISTGNNTSVARRSFGDHCASAQIFASSIPVQIPGREADPIESRMTLGLDREIQLLCYCAPPNRITMH